MNKNALTKVRRSFVERFVYMFDNTLSKGSLWLVYWLVGLTILILAVMSAIFISFNVNPEFESMEQASRMLFVELLAPGTLAGEEGTYLYYTLVFIVSMFGIVFFSTLVGLITTAFEERLESLRRGRSRVIESGHTVIFGWSEKVPGIIREFVEARRDESPSSIVVFGDADKVEMEEQIHSQVPDLGNIKVICRSGHAGELQATEITSVNSAKSILIVAPEVEKSDIQVIKNMMALVKNPMRREKPYQIITEIRDPSNTELASIVGGKEVNIISVTEYISRLIVQTSGQAGLPTVYDELLSFTGNEFHFCPTSKDMVGRTFGKMVLGYAHSVIVGVSRDQNKKVMLSPPFDMKIDAEDQLIVLAESQRQALVNFTQTPEIDKAAIIKGKGGGFQASKTLVLGYNWKLPMILKRLNEMTEKGSSLTFMSSVALEKTETSAYKETLKNFSKLSFIEGNTADRGNLLNLKVPDFDNVIVLSSSKEEHNSDAHTLVTLLHVRNIVAEANAQTNIVTEMLDVQNMQLAQAARADDFIVSDQVISRLMAQYSENAALHQVYSEMLEPEGVEVKLRPASQYVKLGTPVNFYTVTASVLEAGEIALGYRLSNEVNQKNKNYGVYLNPVKSNMINGFSESDKIIVLAE